MAAATALGSYDYVICGGGTTGLTLASRLTEVPYISVAVIEAGIDRSNDANVLAPSLLTALYGNPDYDWIYTTTSQPAINGRVIGHPRGKQLRGSSAINYLAYTHASQQNINDWGSLGNEVDGQVHNGFPHNDAFTPFDEAWPRTYDSLGLAISSDPKDGLALGGYNILTNVNPDTNSRSYAATTYLKAAAGRPNLKVFTSALVHRVLFDTTGEVPTAIGVSFSVNGTLYTVNANSEVILSAGSYGSPQILELSGIGSEDVLSAADVDVISSNPNVGENP